MIANDRLTTAFKERLQHFRTAAGQNSATNLGRVVQLRMIQDLHDRTDGARFRIIRAIHKAPDAGVHQCARAHCARLNCNKQLALFQAVVTNGSTCFTQGNDLSMGRRVGVGDVAIPSPPYDPAAAHYDRAYWHLSCLKRPVGAAQGFLHP